MGFFSKLFGKKDSGETVTEKDIEQLDKAFEERRYDEAIASGEKLLHLQGPDEVLRYVHQKVGLAYFQTRRPERALDYLEPLTVGSTSAMDWFNLATPAMMAGQAEKGLEALDKAIEYFTDEEHEAGPPPGFMLFFSMQALAGTQNYPAAFKPLDMLKQIYCGLGETDMTFLRLRGLPGFIDVMERGLPILEQMPKDQLAVWLDELDASMNEEGRHVVAQMRGILLGEGGE